MRAQATLHLRQEWRARRFGVRHLQQRCSSTSFRFNRNGDHPSKLDATFETHGLPLPPILDPAAQTAIHKYQAPKSMPVKAELTPFQQKLAKNPYANALATPVRMCSVTATRLPRFFLLNYGLIAHPTTGAPWYLPENIEVLRINLGEDLQETKSNGEEQAESETTSSDREDSSNTSIKATQDAQANVETSPRRGLGTYVLARQDLLVAITHDKPRRWQQIIPHRQREMLRSAVKDIVWRNDMDEFVTELLRQKVTQRLIGLACLKRKSKYYIHPLSTSLDSEFVAQQFSQPACVLYLGPTGRDGTGTSQGGQSQRIRGEQHIHTKTNAIQPPKELMSMISVSGSPSTKNVPIYNLPKMLGKEYTTQLRKTRELASSEYATIRDEQEAMVVQALLWRLRCFLDECGQT